MLAPSLIELISPDSAVLATPDNPVATEAAIFLLVANVAITGSGTTAVSHPYYNAVPVAANGTFPGTY